MSGVLLDGFDDFLDSLSNLADRVSDDEMAEALKVAADAFVEDMHRLPSPRGTRKTRTHMLDSISAERKGAGWEIGWGKFYGYFVEYGTSKMRPQPHLFPTWENNEVRYMKLVQEKIFGGT